MEQLGIVRESLLNFAVEIVNRLPQLFFALLILIVGWLVAKLAHYIIVKGLKAVSFQVITDKVGLDGFLKKGGIRLNTIELLGLIVYWLILLAFVLATMQYLDWGVAGLVRDVALFIPDVIIAVLILAIGLYFARFMADAVTAYMRNVGSDDSVLVGRVVYYTIAVFVVIAALDKVGVVGDIFQSLLLILFGGVVLALALAFGLGGQKWAADKLEKFSKKK